MDHALPAPTPLDRRRLITLVLAGTTGAALTRAGVAVSAPAAWDGPQIAIDSIRRTITGIAAGYDQWGPVKAAAALRPAEVSMHGVFAGYNRMTPRQLKDAKAVYARLLTMAATAADDTGRHAEAARTADMAASLAYEVGDTQTAGHAWSVAASALGNTGKHRHAISSAQRARAVAAGEPSGVMALAEEAVAAARIGDLHAVLEAADAAEKAHTTLTADQWGTPGYSLDSFHGAKMAAFVGWALAEVSLFDEATPRLDAAAELARGTGLLVFVRLAQARMSLGTGDTDGAHDLAAVAVASAEQRPASWVVGTVARLNTAARGAFADLVEQTSRWGFAAPGGIRA